MKKLWIFGDSFSATNKRNEIEKWRKLYIKWKGYTPKVWCEFLNDSLQLRLHNLSISATDNYSIFDTIIDSIDAISENDIVIIGWTSTLRFRLIDKSNKFNTVRPSDSIGSSTLTHSNEYNSISINTINEMLINRDNELYQYELNRFIKIINKSLNTKNIIHWSPFQSTQPIIHIHKINVLHYLELIKEETNGEVNDTHYSENGHKDLAKYFYKILN
jgi:hypothetical protein